MSNYTDEEYAAREARKTELKNQMVELSSIKLAYEDAQYALSNMRGSVSSAIGGLEFMTSTQLSAVQTRVETAVNPKEALLDMLDFKKNYDSGTDVYVPPLQEIIESLDTLSKIYSDIIFNCDTIYWKKEGELRGLY